MILLLNCYQLFIVVKYMEFIKNINAKETFLIRHPVLREGKPVESCHFNGDNLETTVHFGYFKDRNLIGVVSLFNSKNTNFISEIQFQIRGMAILPLFQKQGIGKKLISHCEEFLQNKKDSLIWFNARENAVSFYEKLYFIKIGAPFTIPDIGLHYLMKKKLMPQE